MLGAFLLQLERALQLSADMQKRNVPRNVHTHSALMNVCIKCGQLRLALECWENMQRDAIEPNVVRHLSTRQFPSTAAYIAHRDWHGVSHKSPCTSHYSTQQAGLSCTLGQLSGRAAQSTQRVAGQLISRQ